MKILKPLVLFLLICSFGVIVYAHPGQTDANGGHYNHSTGEYHYHHGYPAHSHAGGCPYDYDDKTGWQSGSSGGSSSGGSNYIPDDSPETSDTSNSSSSSSSSGCNGNIDWGFIIMFGIMAAIGAWLGMSPKK